MKVKELIEKLKQQDSELEIFCCSEDDLRLFDIVDVSEEEGEKVPGDDQIPYLKIGKSQISQKLAIITRELD